MTPVLVHMMAPHGFHRARRGRHLQAPQYDFPAAHVAALLLFGDNEFDADVDCTLSIGDILALIASPVNFLGARESEEYLFEMGEGRRGPLV